MHTKPPPRGVDDFFAVRPQQHKYCLIAIAGCVVLCYACVRVCGRACVVVQVSVAGAVGPLAVAACGARVRVFLSDLAEPAGLLDLEELDAASGGGVRGVAALGFDVVSVANGGESEFLPEVYRPFFKPEEEEEEERKGYVSEKD